MKTFNVKFFLLIMALLIVEMTYGQKKLSKTAQESFTCYLPTGEKYLVKPNTTVGQLHKQFEVKGRVWEVFLKEEDAVIAFKSFTMEPLFVLALNNKKYSLEKIQNLINSVNDDVTGFRYYWKNRKIGLIVDLEMFIEKDILDESFILSTMGEPNEIKQTLYDGNPATSFVYSNLGIRIYLNNQKAIGYEVLED